MSGRFASGGGTGGRSAAALVVLALAAAAAAGCGRKEPPDPYLGDMGDTSWAGLVTADGAIGRESASGAQVTMDGFRGSFVWVDYAAPWCDYCKDQAGAIRKLGGDLPEVVFLTVVTSRSSNYEDVPDRGTAQSWAKARGLEPDRVLVAKNLWSRTVPAHRLFSPEGHTIYAWTGYLPAERISETLKSRMAEWGRWSSTGEKAEWMK